MKMDAALMYGPNDVRFEQVERPACPEGGLILKVMAVGLCGSDIRNLTSDSRKGNYPFIYGHEIVGVVDEVHPAVKEYKVGDRLFLFPGTYCMKCDDCISGHSENCHNAEGLAGTGGFAQYVAVSARKIELGGIYPIPDDVSYAAASLGEPLTSVYACEENCHVGYPDTLVIIGAGPIGCFMSQLAKTRGAQKVIMIDINATRLEMSRQFGVDETINSAQTDPIAAVKVLTGGRGADKVISANVDFYSGLVYEMLGIPEELFTPIFAIARIVGWSAHRLEELINMDKIIRPAYMSVQDRREYVRIDDRG